MAGIAFAKANASEPFHQFNNPLKYVFMYLRNIIFYHSLKNGKKNKVIIIALYLQATAIPMVHSTILLQTRTFGRHCSQWALRGIGT
jgi:hypothetical protein